MADGIGRNHAQQHVQFSKQAAKAEDLENAKELKDIFRSSKQDAAKDSAQAKMQTRSPLEGKLRKSKKSLKNRKTRVSKSEKTQKGDGAKDKTSEVASKYQKNNPELKKESLLLLRQSLKEGGGKTKEDVQQTLKKFYPDSALADEALEYLMETTDGELRENIRDAKTELNKDFGKEVAAGRNMGKESRAFSEKGLGSPGALREMYRDITDNPRTPTDLFQEFADKFDFEQMQETIKFLFHSLGADFRAKGPSIPKGELHRMMTECKTLQAILGVYNFFKSRMKLIENALKRNGIVLNKKVSFKALAKIYMLLVSDRYPSPEKVLSLAKKLGIDSTLIGQIIFFTQMRDAIKQTSPRLYRSTNHRDELWLSMIEALEDLEIDLEEEEEEDFIYYDEENEEKEIEEVEKEAPKDTLEVRAEWTDEDKEEL
ncbi:Uncharacterized protein AB751O23_AF_00160 [Chlamydiales bacterium SCGC AB-751-O23]|jgi:type III secretion protein W|nr:Uncharacterized protein AB751O23_AF_00160 [Chlamydiales bacterium SCGC AB-751-O23]